MRQAQRPIPLPRASGANPGLRGMAANDNDPRCRAVNGNLASDGTRTYTFDAADRLKTITQGATVVTFAYDGLGRRLKQTVGAAETRYLWCGAAICQQRSATDGYQKRFYAEGEYVHTGTKKYLTLTDHLGSVRDVIDITGTPTLVAAFDYRPYGAVARSWGTVTTGYTYAGLFAQTNTGLLLSTTRAYNPANGKWLNVDPIREEGGINLTGYVGGRPMAAVDPLGLEAFINGFPEGSIIGKFFDRMPRIPGVFIVGMHGSDYGADIGVEELALLIVRHPDYKPGMPVLLMSCSTGKQQDGYAAQLAWLMNTQVFAPSTEVWITGDGSHYIAPRIPSDGIGRFFDFIGVPPSWHSHNAGDITRPGILVPFPPPSSRPPEFNPVIQVINQ